MACILSQAFEILQSKIICQTKKCRRYTNSIVIDFETFWIGLVISSFISYMTLVVVCIIFLVQWISSADSFFFYFLKHVNELCVGHTQEEHKKTFEFYYFIIFRRRPQDLEWRIFCRKCSSDQKEGTNFKIRNQARNCGGSQGGK